MPLRRVGVWAVHLLHRRLVGRLPVVLSPTLPRPRVGACLVAWVCARAMQTPGAPPAKRLCVSPSGGRAAPTVEAVEEDVVCLLSDDDDDADGAAAAAAAGTAPGGGGAVVGGGGAGGWGVAPGGGGGAAAFAGMAKDQVDRAGVAPPDVGATVGLKGWAPPRPDVKPWLAGGLAGGPAAAAAPAAAGLSTDGGDVKAWAPAPAGWPSATGGGGGGGGGLEPLLFFHPVWGRARRG